MAIEEVLDTLQEKEEPKKGNGCPGFTFVYSERWSVSRKVFGTIGVRPNWRRPVGGLVEDHHGATRISTERFVSWSFVNRVLVGPVPMVCESSWWMPRSPWIEIPTVDPRGLSR